MKAMVLKRIARLAENPKPLEPAEIPTPVPGEGELLVKISACGVCHTELDEIEGRTPPAFLPIVLGHQAIGRVAALGPAVTGFALGDRVGIAWIFSACGACAHCLAGMENLCERFQATGRDAHGGYAEFAVVPAAFAHSIPEIFSDAEAAPLLCAGAIGFRSLRLAGIRDGDALGLTGFGSSAHLVLKMVRHRFPRTRVFVFARSSAEQGFARELGALWAGDAESRPPDALDAVIDTTPVWRPVVAALAVLKSGGRLVINAIRKETTDQEELLKLDYAAHLWREKEIKSVANVTRRDVREFLELAGQVPIKPEVQVYTLKEANRALLDLKERRIRGAKVLRID
ncbi:MAG: zinc-dependent alcohol dehydrogenase family protein [Hyphomicrobiales bacterium]